MGDTNQSISEQIKKEAEARYPYTDKLPRDTGYNENDVAEKEQDAFEAGASFRESLAGKEGVREVDMNPVYDFLVKSQQYEYANIIRDLCYSNISPMKSEGSEERRWQQIISDRINHFANNYHKYEANELHNALNTILRLVPDFTPPAPLTEK